MTKLIIFEIINALYTALLVAWFVTLTKTPQAKDRNVLRWIFFALAIVNTVLEIPRFILYNPPIVSTRTFVVECVCFAIMVPLYFIAFKAYRRMRNGTEVQR